MMAQSGTKLGTKLAAESESESENESESESESSVLILIARRRPIGPTNVKYRDDAAAGVDATSGQ